MEQFELPRLYQPITAAKIVYAPTQVRITSNSDGEKQMEIGTF